VKLYKDDRPCLRTKFCVQYDETDDAKFDISKNKVNSAKNVPASVFSEIKLVRNASIDTKSRITVFKTIFFGLALKYPKIHSLLFGQW
jgi:hypothetical protein